MGRNREAVGWMGDRIYRGRVTGAGEAMQVHLDVREDVARLFAAEPGGITQAALEALAIEGVLCGKLTEHQARQMLGISSRYQMDGFLKAHGVLLPTTMEDVAKDSEIAISSSR